MKTTNFLFTALMAAFFLIGCRTISAQTSYKTYISENESKQMLDSKIKHMVSWEPSKVKKLDSENKENNFEENLVSLEKSARFYPSAESVTTNVQPETSMSDILDELYKEVKFNPSDYLEGNK